MGKVKANAVTTKAIEQGVSIPYGKGKAIADVVRDTFK